MSSLQKLLFCCHFILLCDLTLQTVFNATTSYQFHNQSLICNESEPCTIRCDTNHACRDATATCPSNYPCNIYCSAFASCLRIQINPPQNQSLFKLVSDGHRALYGVHLPLALYRDDYTDYTLICDGGPDSLETCGWTSITCPKYAHCSIYCSSNNACQAMRVDCPSEAEWECNIKCLNSYACFATVINAVNKDQVNITCSETTACHNLVLSFNSTLQPTTDTIYPTV